MTKIRQIQFYLHSTKSQQSLQGALYCKLNKDPFEQTLGNSGKEKQEETTGWTRLKDGSHDLNDGINDYVAVVQPYRAPNYHELCAVVQYLCPDFYFSHLCICVMMSQSGGPKHRHKTLTGSGCRLSSWVEGLIEGMYQSDIQSDPGPNYWIGYWDEKKNVTRPIKCQKSASQNLRHRITQCMVSHMLLCVRPVGMSAVWSYFRKKKSKTAESDLCNASVSWWQQCWEL